MLLSIISVIADSKVGIYPVDLYTVLGYIDQEFQNRLSNCEIGSYCLNQNQ